MKKVLFVFHSANYYSGATRSMTDIVIQLHKKKEINALVLIPEKDGSAKELLESNGIKVIFLPFKSLMQDERAPIWRRTLKFPVYCVRYLKQKSLVRRRLELFSDIDVVYSNTSTILLGAMIAEKLNVPHIWHFREFRHEDHKIHFFLGERWHMHYVSTHVDKLIMISKSMARKHIKYIPNEKMEIVYNELPKSYILPQKNYNIDKPLQLLIAGDVKPGKGQLDAVEAVGYLKQLGIEIFLSIAGKCSDIEYKKKIDDRIAYYGINENVIFCGMVKDMNSLREKMDIGIVASSLEAFGRVTIEGMLAHLCMVGCSSGGTKELIKDKVTGLLYEPGKIQGLVECLKYLNENRDDLKKISETGFQYAECTFTEGACSEKVYQIIMNMRTRKIEKEGEEDV